MLNPYHPRTVAIPTPRAALLRRAALTVHSWGVADPDLLRQRRLAAGLAAVTVLAVAAIAWAWMNRPEPEPVCDLVIPSEEVTFLIDSSDPLSEDQQQFLAGKVLEAADRLAVGGRLRLVQLAPQAGGESPLIESEPLCKPRDGIRASFLAENPKLLRRFFTEHFQVPLKVAVADLNKAHQAPTTPLIEGLYALARRLEGTAQTSRRTLVIASDLMQNSSLASFYRGESSFPVLAKTHSAYLSGLSGFRGLAVEIFRLKGRSHARQKASHDRFWADYFQAAGARDYRVFDL